MTTTTATPRVDEAVRTDRDHSRVEDRRIETRFLIPSTEQIDRHNEKNTAALDITVSHSKTHKGYVLSINRVIVGPNFVRWAMELRNEDPCPVSSYVLLERTPRYSAKRLEELHLETLARLITEDLQTIEALLEWATRANRG